MIFLSIYLAKLIGLVLLIVGFAMLVRLEDFKKTVNEISRSNAMMTIISIIPLIVGLAIILAHNIWVADWIVIITIIGWLIFIAALLRLFFHKMIMKKMAKMAQSKSFFITLGVILLICGAIITVLGFW